jgi:hypothetical protein
MAAVLILTAGCYYGDPRSPAPGVLRSSDGQLTVFYPTCGRKLMEVRVENYASSAVLWDVKYPKSQAATDGAIALGDDSQFEQVLQPLRKGLPGTFNITVSYAGGVSGGQSIGTKKLPGASAGASHYWQADDVGGPFKSVSASSITEQMCDGMTADPGAGHQ